MISSKVVENNAIQVLFDYFERALQDIGVGVWLSLLRPGNEENFRNKIKSKVYSTLSFDAWQFTKAEVLKESERHLRWEPGEDPEEEIWAHYRMQSAIVATIMGDRRQLQTLAALLVIEPMNRKLSISYFLGNLTNGKVGLTYKELPTRTRVLRWVKDIEHIELTDRLSEIAKLRYE